MEVDGEDGKESLVVRLAMVCLGLERLVPMVWRGHGRVPMVWRGWRVPMVWRVELVEDQLDPICALHAKFEFNPSTGG